MKLLAPLLIAVLSYACTSPVGTVGPDGEIEVREVTVPATAGIYRLYNVDGGGLSALVQYAPPDSLLEQLPAVDVLIYRVERPLEDEIARWHAETMRADRSPFGARDGAIYQSEGGLPLASGDSAYRAVILVDIGTFPHRELLYMRQVGDRYVVARTTYRRIPGVNIDHIFDDVAAAVYSRARRVEASR